MGARAVRGTGRPSLIAALAVALAWGAAVAATMWFPAAGGLAGGVGRATGGAADSLGRLADLLRVSYAFSVGMVAGVNPCGFALLPTYLALFAGTASGEPLPVGRQLARACGVGALVTLGFVVLFGIAGLLLTLATVAVAGALAGVGLIVGTLLVAGGGLLLGGGSLPATLAHAPVVGLLAGCLGGVARRSGALGYFAYGIAYGLASLGCALPLFLGVVGTALTSGGALHALRQYLLYALGMGAVITALTLLAAVAGQGALRPLRGTGRWVGAVSASLMVLAGAYVIHYWLVNGTLLLALRR